MEFSFGQILEGFNRVFTLYLVFPAIFFLGLYYTLKLRFVQISKLKMSFATLFKKSTGEGSISHYQAVASILAGNFGTGNISGMAVALATGGPGALMWMWVMAFFGAAIQFVNCVLGVKYRKKNDKGEYVGGPMHYLADGLGFKKIAACFSFLAIIGAFTVGGLVQINSMALPLAKMGVSPWLTGITVAICVGLVILGGAKRIAVMCSAVVPFMAFIYLGAAFVILGLHLDGLIPASIEVLRSSLGTAPLIGGTLGYTVMKAITTGFDRGIFATDAGTGLVPMLQAGAKTKHPVTNGVVSLLAPFLVMVVCSSTALVLMVTGAYKVEGLASTNMVTYAFSKGLNSPIGLYIVLIALILFGYTTSVAWAACLQKAAGFLFNQSKVKLLLYFYILVIPFGAIAQVEFVWQLADLALTSMVILNLIGVAGLSNEAIFMTREYFKVKEVYET